MAIDQHLPSPAAPAAPRRTAANREPIGLRSKPAVRAAGVLVLLTLMLTALFPARADAATHVSPWGQTGAVWMNGPMINAWDLGTRLQNGTTFYTKNFNVGGFTVGRSPSSFSQRVNVTSSIQRWDGTWVNIQRRDWTGTVSGSGTLNFPEWTWSPTNVPNNRHTYRVVHGVGWFDYASGQTLAVTGLVSNSFADNRCSTRNFSCSSYTYGVTF